MIFGMTPFTFLHVAISLIGIASGLIVLQGLIADQKRPGWTALFLATTVLTSVTGFGFPFVQFMPSHAVAIISLVVLSATIIALYGLQLAGIWRAIYVIGAVLSLYLNVFVLVVQLFLKVPVLKALAPTQSEPPFAITQGIVLVAFVLAGLLALRRFTPAPVGV